MKRYVYDHKPDIPQLEKAQERAYYFQRKREERECAPLDLNENRTTIQNATREEVINALHGVVTRKKRL